LYLDSGATNHITDGFDKLTMHDLYHDHAQVRTANGTSMHINCIGTSVIPTSYRPLHLRRVLHVPCAKKHMVSIHRFNIHNHTFIELHLYFFSHQGPSHEEGIYPLSMTLLSSLQEHAFAAILLPLDC
jgi:hypothetical protein